MPRKDQSAIYLVSILNHSSTIPSNFLYFFSFLPSIFSHILSHRTPPSPPPSHLSLSFPRVPHIWCECKGHATKRGKKGTPRNPRPRPSHHPPSTTSLYTSHPSSPPSFTLPLVPPNTRVPHNASTAARRLRHSPTTTTPAHNYPVDPPLAPHVPSSTTPLLLYAPSALLPPALRFVPPAHTRTRSEK